MALAPTRHFYPASFFDSPVRFFKYGASNPLRRRVFYAAKQQQENYGVDSRRNSNQRNPQFRGERHASNGNWIEKWSDARQPKQPNTVVEYENSESENEAYGDGNGSDDGGSGGSTMEKIVEKLKKFGYMEGERESRGNRGERVIERGSVEDIFYYEEGRLPNSRGGFSLESGDLFGGGGGGEVKFPWEKPAATEEDEEREGLATKKTRTSLAELTLPESELRRLRSLTFQKKHKTRIGGAGVTHEVVKMIHEKWKESEIVRLKVDGAPALNMKRMHEILERKTGGLIVWRSGTSLSLYRGVSYEVPALHLKKRILNRTDASSTQIVRNTPTREISEFPFASNTDRGMGTAVEKLESISEENDDVEKPVEVQYEVEMDEILDSLGPRYEDWPGPDPLPVDADRLPGIIPRFQPPFRILPYGVRRSLGQKEATSLRRLARFLPPHFAIGRSRQLQGLAMAIIKLWEKSSIAKVALKRGVQLTTSERMAEEIKTLTGGVLLSRNKDFLVFYRGKNFLSTEVTEVLMERERLAESMQDEEEQARLKASAIITPQTDLAPQSAATGTLEETIEADAKWGKKLDNSHKKRVMREADVMRHAGLVRKLERNLDIAERKLMKAERALAKVEVSLQPSTQQADPESITDEERFMFRKLGLRMKAFLLLGRRGVFDGTVENMHLHWKYRELVKVVVNAKTFEQVKKVALALEAESGGVLVSVDRINRKKFAIVVFRGRDYKRPSMLRPKNLLTKRKALARSIEIQRQQALLKHMSVVQTKVDKLRSELEQMDMIKDRGDETFYDKLDSAYGTSDDEIDDQSEEDDDEAYLETYEDEGEDETNESIRNLYDDTDLSHDEKNFGLETDSDNPEFYSRNQYDI